MSPRSLPGGLEQVRLGKGQGLALRWPVRTLVAQAAWVSGTLTQQEVTSQPEVQFSEPETKRLDTGQPEGPGLGGRPFALAREAAPPHCGRRAWREALEDTGEMAWNPEVGGKAGDPACLHVVGPTQDVM